MTTKTKRHPQHCRFPSLLVRTRRLQCTRVPHTHTHIYILAHIWERNVEREKVGREGEVKNLESLNTAFTDNKKPGNNVLNTCTFALRNMQKSFLPQSLRRTCVKSIISTTHGRGLSRPSYFIQNKSALWATIRADRTTHWAQPQH